jgi:archaetidylinositol phosphate synthase
MIPDIKHKVRTIFDLITKNLIWIGLSPNHLTILGLLFSLLAAFSYSSRNNISASIFLILGAASDAFDGSIARVTGKITKAGGILDSTLDRIGETMILTGIMIGGYCSYHIGLLAIISAYMVSYIRGRAEVEGIKMEGIGIGERPERLLILVIFTILNKISISIIILIAVCLFTIYQRISHTFKVLK